MRKTLQMWIENANYSSDAYNSTKISKKLCKTNNSENANKQIPVPIIWMIILYISANK